MAGLDVVRSVMADGLDGPYRGSYDEWNPPHVYSVDNCMHDMMFRSELAPNEEEMQPFCNPYFTAERVLKKYGPPLWWKHHWENERAKVQKKKKKKAPPSFSPTSSNKITKPWKRKAGRKGGFSEKKKRIIAADQGWKCKTCKKQLRYRWEVDHIVPKFKGGSDDVTNGQALCLDCHAHKTYIDVHCA